NASAFRMQPEVPVVVPEVNAAHLRVLEQQSWRAQCGGFIVTNPNCSATGLVMALAPLERQFGVEKAFAVTMQAVSGAGYPGVASLDILGNVIPYVAKEEEKMESETCKMLGRLNGVGISPAELTVSAHCNRVPVEDGHTEAISVKLRKPATREQIIAAFRDFSARPQQLKLPSAPQRPIIFFEADHRPQPVLDVNAGGGMSVSIGRLRDCRLLDWQFAVVSHHTVR